MTKYSFYVHQVKFKSSIVGGIDLSILPLLIAVFDLNFVDGIQRRMSSVNIFHSDKVTKGHAHDPQPAYKKNTVLLLKFWSFQLFSTLYQMIENSL